MKNDYEIRDEITAILLPSRSGTVRETLIDTKDLEKAKSFKGRWISCWDPHGHTFYVKGYIRNKSNRRISLYLHRLILDTPEGLVVDHINFNTLDNRSQNLRTLTHAENCQNRKLKANNKSGARGVSFHKSTKKYRVQITVNSKKHYLGLYENVEDAKKVAIEGRKRLMKYSKEQSDLV